MLFTNIAKSLIWLSKRNYRLSGFEPEISINKNDFSRIKMENDSLKILLEINWMMDTIAVFNDLRFESTLTHEKWVISWEDNQLLSKVRCQVGEKEHVYEIKKGRLKKH